MEKEDVLLENGCFYARHRDVTDKLFLDIPFFDARDIVQVKYEMLRSVSKGEKNVSQAARDCGFSRESFYKNKALFDAGGLEALLPRKTGPKGAYKFQKEGVDFVEGYIRERPGAKPAEIARQMERQIGLKVHPRTIDRHMRKKRNSRC